MQERTNRLIFVAPIFDDKCRDAHQMRNIGDREVPLRN
jgi:hypothetical protein